ncbi:MAG: DUF6730 family protein [Bacteroidota bacterium]
MNKLETITQLLVNELTDFEANVKRLENGLQRAEDLKVKFDLTPIDNLVSELKSFQQKETEDREVYVNRLNRKLENAKIYPKWAVITFVVSIFIGFSGLFFGYRMHVQTKNEKEASYQKAVATYQSHMGKFFDEYPSAKKQYELWIK